MKKKIPADIGRVCLLFTFFVLITIGCKKEAQSPLNETGTMADRDGNVYSTVKIGNQWWMAEDLKVKTYQNGDSVIFKPISPANPNTVETQKGDSLVFDSLDIKWQKTTPAYCINDASVGFIYNGYAVNDPRILAPAGWHIPTDAEWKTLEITLGMSAMQADSTNWRGTNQGDQLKIGENSDNPPAGHWQYCDAYGLGTGLTLPAGTFVIWPTNSSRFSARAGGCRLFNGVLGNPGENCTGFWWSSTMHDSVQAYYRYLDYNKPNVFRYFGDKRYGFGVRCVKD